MCFTQNRATLSGDQQIIPKWGIICFHIAVLFRRLLPLSPAARICANVFLHSNAVFFSGTTTGALTHFRKLHGFKVYKTSMIWVTFSIWFLSPYFSVFQGVFSVFPCCNMYHYLFIMIKNISGFYNFYNINFIHIAVKISSPFASGTVSFSPTETNHWTLNHLNPWQPYSTL